MSRKPEITTSSTTSILESILLIAAMCVLAIRTTYTESPHITSTDFSLALGNDGISLLITTSVFFIVATWFIFRFCAGKNIYRPTGIEPGAAVFTAAACIAVFVAANKRLAITDAVTIIAPVMLAIVMVQLLNRPWKIKLVLWILTALALVQVYQCADQCFVSNDMMIEQYENEPEKQLEQIGIEPGSFNHMAYEHRLYSRDVKGFFVTGNSAGAFFIMAIAAGAALIFWDGPKKISIYELIFIILLLVAIGGLCLTRSKGAIGAFVLATGMLGTFLLIGKKLHKYKWFILIAIVLAGTAMIAAVIGHGLQHGTLPGGNSMLVRWQYWTGATQMSADHPFTGVGGANFGSHYTLYKPAAAPESIKDPHCFPLSILAQYGPLGLLGFIIAFTLPMLRLAMGKKNSSPPDIPEDNKPKAETLALIAGIAVSAAMLLIRPMLIKTPSAEGVVDLAYITMYLYIIPLIFFAIGFLMIWAVAKQYSTFTETCLSTVPMAVVFCCLCAVLIANLVDFAIFEPGIMTTFWIMIAVAISLKNLNTANDDKHPPPPKSAKIIVLGSTIAAMSVLMFFAIVPAVKASSIIQQAIQGKGIPYGLLNKAAAADKLSPTASELKAKYYQQEYYYRSKKYPALLENAATALLTAIERDIANFKYHERLSGIYLQIAETSTDSKRETNLNKAYEHITKAIELYPGLGRLRFDAAQIAEQLNYQEAVMDNYKKAVEIEQVYRKQFEVMYPGRDMVSRLGNDKYRYAKEKVIQLKKQGKAQ